MSVVALVQARMGSTRLPGKVLADVAGAPLLERCLRRLSRAETLDEVVVATSSSPRDDKLAEWCDAAGWRCVRGSEDDVLGRFADAARVVAANVVVRICGDCPLMEPSIVDRVVRALQGADADYASNFFPRRTFPRGLDVEALSREVLDRLAAEDANPEWREHVTEYLLHHPDRFRIAAIENEEDLSHLRWTVDEPADLELVRRVVSHFGHDRFTWNSVCELLQSRPLWTTLNAGVAQKVVV